MLLTDLRRRDPNLIALRRAIRVAVAVPVSILVLVNIPATTETALFGVFACLALLLFGNFAGKWKLRAAAYLTATVVGGVVVALCSLLARTLWPAMMAMAVVALFISMFAMLRGYLAAAQNVVLLAAVLALTSAEPQQTPQILLAWTIGGLIATAAAVVLLPAHPYVEITERLAGVYRNFATMLRERWSGDAAVAAAVSAGEQATQDLSQIHALLDGNLQRPSGLASPDPDLGVRVHCADQIQSHEDAALRVPPPAEQEPLLTAANTQLANVTAQQLDHLADKLQYGTTTGIDAAAMYESRVEHLRQVNSWFAQRRTHLDPAALRDHLDECSPLRFISVHAELAGMAGEARVQDPILRQMAEQQQQRWWERIGMQLSFDSPWLRLALRTAVALALSVGVANMLKPEHSFWVVLGTLVALRFDASGTGRTAWQALWGTAVGAAISAGLILLIGDNPTAWAILLPIGLFLAAFTPSTFSLGIGQAAFTVAVIVLFSLLFPVDVETAEIRLEDVALGLAIGVVISLVMWPRGLTQVLAPRCGDALSAATDHMVLSLDRAAGGAVDEQMLDAGRKQATTQLLRARDSLELVLSQHPPDPVELQQWESVLGTARITIISGDLITSCSNLIAHYRPETGGRIPEVLVVPLLAEARALRDRMRVISVAVSSPEGPQEVDQQEPRNIAGAKLNDFRDSLTTWLGNNTEHNDAIADASPAIMVWTSDLMMAVDHSAAELEDSLSQSVN
ncbi:MAG: FUSC family protein [Actinomycetia bacterium]|nr:FUSC family protein [Actinomycetes bacterium]